MSGTQSVFRRPWPEAGLVFAVALALRLAAAHIGSPAPLHGLEMDEFYHLLAARSWVEHGTLAVGDGRYTRAYLFTIGLGWLFNAFGESELIGRGLSILLGSLSVAVVFLWTRSLAGSSAAWIAAALYAVAPIALEMSVFIRFYTLHGLAFFLGAAGVHALATRRLGAAAWIGLAAASALSLALALHLQLTTLIGLVGLAAWLVVTAWRRGWLADAWAEPRLRWLAIGALGLLAAAGAWAVASSLTSMLWDTYTWAPLWNRGNQDSFLFYHYLFLDQYPTFWALLPLAAIVALARKPEPAILCLSVFCAAILLHSLSGQKWDRYVYYLLPFFFVPWGIAIAETVPALGNLAGVAVERLGGQGLSPSLRQVARFAALAAVGIFLAAGNSAFPGAVKMLLGRGHDVSEPSPSWARATSVLGPWLDRAAVVVTTNAPRALYYFGRADFELNRSVVDEIGTGEDFGIDLRTGRPVIGTAGSLDLVMSCYPSGLFVSESSRWRKPIGGIDDAGADLLEQRAHEIAVAPKWRMRVFAWDRAGTPPNSGCEAVWQSLPGASGGGRSGPRTAE